MRLPLLHPLAAALLLTAPPALAQTGAAPETPPVDTTATDSPELRRLMEADQAARQADWSQLTPDSLRAIWTADSLRQVRVRELLADGAVRTPADHYHAALVLQHGRDSTDYRQAYRLSRAAAEAGYDGARWLVPRAYDRWQLSIGEPQVYGTQFFSGPDGAGLKLDEPHGLDAVTDAERARWGLAPKAAILEMAACVEETGDFRACAARRDAAPSDQ
ncbi:MAG: hypothetical protein R3362_02715 [Rhodothermales bacterium]|nr:hypothetical protein [Rhodothermales bacterium]